MVARESSRATVQRSNYPGVYAHVRTCRWAREKGQCRAANLIRARAQFLSDESVHFVHCHRSSAQLSNRQFRVAPARSLSRCISRAVPRPLMNGNAESHAACDRSSQTATARWAVEQHCLSPLGATARSHHIAVAWQSSRRAANTQPAPVDDVRVDHRRAQVRVAEQILDRADVVAVLEEVGRERMAQRVTAHFLRDACAAAEMPQSDCAAHELTVLRRDGSSDSYLSVRLTRRRSATLRTNCLVIAGFHRLPGTARGPARCGTSVGSPE